MNDDNTGKRRPDQEREFEAGREQRRDEPRQKSDRTKQAEWRGSGVCGDRHTD
jgi:hypothetical protein